MEAGSSLRAYRQKARLDPNALYVSNGLEFPVVAMVSAGRMPAEGEDEREEARLLCVGATRATQRLVIGASGGWTFAARF